VVDAVQACERIGYDAPWRHAGVLDDSLLATQADELEHDPHVHPEHYRWAMWTAYASRACAVPLDDAGLERLLALDAHEASRPRPTFGHGIALDLAERFVLSAAQCERIARHPITHGLSSRTAASLLRKLAARADR
jgi:hypothetical protein